MSVKPQAAAGTVHDDEVQLDDDHLLLGITGEGIDEFLRLLDFNANANVIARGCRSRIFRE